MYFEYIYFARMDSVIDNVNVYHARIVAGKALAESYPVDADLVVGVPDSGLVAAKDIRNSLVSRMEWHSIRTVTSEEHLLSQNKAREKAV